MAACKNLIRNYFRPRCRFTDSLRNDCESRVFTMLRRAVRKVESRAFFYRMTGAVLLGLFLRSPGFANPTLLVTEQGIQSNGNLGWLIQVAADPNLFVDTNVGLGGSLAIELAVEVTGNDLVSVTPNMVDWPNTNPGNNPFNAGIAEGVSMDLNSGQVFAALGSNIFNSGDPVDLLTLETSGAFSTELSWGGHTLLSGTAYQFTGSRIAQAGANYDGYQGTLKVTPCDLNSDAVCDVADINQMFSQGNLVAGVSTTSGNTADLNGDHQINSVDINVWLETAASFNGYTTSYLHGDTDDLGKVSSQQRDVDITDFNALATNFSPVGDGDPTNGPFWDQGNFDGDDDIDITDFNALATNFVPMGYGGSTASIPEPAGLLLIMSALVVLARQRWRSFEGQV